MKKLGLGCMRFPLLDENDRKAFDIPQIEKMVDLFLDSGFTYFDTAYMYHDHESERLIKRVLVDRYERDKFLLATKMPVVYLKEKEDMERIFSEQLEKTGAGYFDYYLLHALNEKYYSMAKELGTFEFVKDKMKEGLVRKMGFSFHDSAEVLDKILTEHPEVSFVQLQINYLDWESDAVQSKKCYEVALKHDKEIIVMEPVKGGALSKLPSKPQKMLNEADDSLSTASWAIRFAASLNNVIMVLSGMSTLEQTKDNISYMENFKPLTKDEMSLCLKVGEILANSVSVPCTSCRYCTESCPKNISIPDYFTLYNKALEKENVNFDEIKKEYDNLCRTFGKASSCIECKNCQEHCPQKIEVVNSLKKVAETFEK